MYVNLSPLSNNVWSINLEPIYVSTVSKGTICKALSAKFVIKDVRSVLSRVCALLVCLLSIYIQQINNACHVGPIV